MKDKMQKMKLNIH